MILRGERSGEKVEEGGRESEGERRERGKGEGRA